MRTLLFRCDELKKAVMEKASQLVQQYLTDAKEGKPLPTDWKGKIMKALCKSDLYECAFLP